jgi:hypothetical protein
MRSLFLLLFSLPCFFAISQVTQTFTSSGNFTVPAGVTSIFVEAWGGGGSGGGALGNSSPQFRAMGGGGGGGAYSSGTFSVTPAQVIPYVVAGQTAPSSTTRIDGGESSFGSISAQGGTGGEPAVATSNSHGGGSGGSGGIGTTNGGNGGSGIGYDGDDTNTQPGGGGGGGTLTNGGNGLNWQTIEDVPTGGLGGNDGGGNGASGSTAMGGQNGLIGSAPGGGGSGAYAAASTTQRSGGAGARGQIRITYNVNMPVGLTFFAIKKVSKSTIIEWLTSYEKSSSHFLIQRSQDGSSFETIGQVNSVGDSEITNSYSYIDNQPKKGNNYYRLVQVDLDGTKNTFKTEMVHMPYERGFMLVNTIVDQENTSLQLSSDVEKYHVSIYEISGQKVLQIENLNFDQLIDTKDLAQGIYVAHCEGNGEVSTFRFVKK